MLNSTMDICLVWLFDVYADAYEKTFAETGQIVESHAAGLLAVAEKTRPDQHIPRTKKPTVKQP